MERVIVLKNVAYASDGASGTVDNLSSVGSLEEGAIGMYNEKGVLLNSTDADYLDCKDFVIAYNIGGDVRITPTIKRDKIFRYTAENYTAPVLQTVVVGGTTSATRLTIGAADEGDVIVRVSDNTFTSMFSTSSVIASVYKKASDTIESVVDKLVAKLNNATNLDLTVTKAGSADNFGITIKTNTRNQLITVSLEGLIEGNRIVTDGTGSSNLPYPGTGVGEDVYAREKDASVILGNSNFRELGDAFYNAPMGAVKTEQYFTIIFQEDLNKPYLGETNVKPLYEIYFPDAENVDLGTTLTSVFNTLIGGKHVAATSIEPADDEDPGTTSV